MIRELTHGSLFSGIEGFGLGAALAGIKTEWSCEFEKYQTEVIKKILEMDTQYMEILERLKTRHLLTSSAVASLARILALLEKAQALRAAGRDYGGKCYGSLQTSNPITSLSKIALYLENGDLNTSYMDFPKSGMMHNGNVYKVASLDCNNVGKGYISLPTPAVSSAKGSPRNRYFGSPTYRGNYHEYIRDGESDGIYPNPELSEALMTFPISWTETNV